MSKTAIIVAIIVAIIGCVGLIYAALVTAVFTPVVDEAVRRLFSTPVYTATATTLLTETLLPTTALVPTTVPSLTPSPPLTATTIQHSDTPSPVLTKALTPTPEFDVIDNFENGPFTIDGETWCGTEGESDPTIVNGELVFNIESTSGDVTDMVRPCTNGRPLRALAARVRLRDGRDSGTAFLLAHLDYPDGQPGHVDFGLLDNGDIFLKQMHKGERFTTPTPHPDWERDGLDVYHVLRIEWSEDQASFYANGKPLMSLPAAGVGYYFLFGSNVYSSGMVISAFDWVGWNYY